MPKPAPTLRLLCGKIASGKSTLASKLAEAEFTVLISQDDWLSALFSDQMTKGADYLRCSKRLQSIMGQHVTSLLNAGTSVVLDFPANTVAQRAWMRRIIEKTGAAHELHLLDVPDEICLRRLRERNAQGDHAFATTQEQFHQFSKHFVAPAQNEGFLIVIHSEK